MKGFRRVGFSKLSHLALARCTDIKHRSNFTFLVETSLSRHKPEWLYRIINHVALFPVLTVPTAAPADCSPLHPGDVLPMLVPPSHAENPKSFTMDDREEGRESLEARRPKEGIPRVKDHEPLTRVQPGGPGASAWKSCRKFFIAHSWDDEAERRGSSQHCHWVENSVT